MEKKELIRFIKNYFKEKRFNVSEKGFFGPLCVYERDDICFIIAINRSKFSDMQYLEYNYIIKELNNTNTDINGFHNLAMKLWQRIAEFKPCDYTYVDLKKVLDKIYKVIIEPIIDGGLDFISMHKDFAARNATAYEKDVLVYLMKYRDYAVPRSSKAYRKMFEKYTKKSKKIKNKNTNNDKLIQNSSLYREIYGGFMTNKPGKEQMLRDSRRRVCFFDEDAKVIRELRFNNDEEVKKGIKLLDEYKSIVGDKYQFLLVLI